MAPRSAATPAKVTGSIGFTPKRSDWMIRVTRSAPPNPHTRPITTSRTPRLSTSPRIVPGRRPQGKPDPDLPLALGHRVGHHPVDPDQGESQRRAGEAPQQQRVDPGQRNRLAGPLLHRAHPRERNQRIDLGERAPEPGERRGGSLLRFHHEEQTPGGKLRQGKKQLGLLRLHRAIGMRIRDDPDHGRAGACRLHHPPDRALSSPHPAHRFLIHDDDGRRPLAILRRELPARDQPHPHRAEISRRHGPIPDGVVGPSRAEAARRSGRGRCPDPLPPAIGS